MEPLIPFERACPWHRRQFLGAALATGLTSLLTPVSHMLARAAEKKKEPAQSLIVLWLGGGPSQLETFDPHPGTNIAAGSQARDTKLKGVQIDAAFERLADQMEHVSLIRSLVSKEGDHERGTYTLRTGYRPDPTVIHPAIGAILCRELPTGTTEIPRHINILPGQWVPRGGFLGDDYDAFKMVDPKDPVPDVRPLVSSERDEARAKDIEVIDRAFAKGRQSRVDRTQHSTTVGNARKMMSSEQLKAFDVMREPKSVRLAYGDTPFGRGCLAALRLIEVGVRCVEVTLNGWDTHFNNHDEVKKMNGVLDPAFASLIKDLRERNLFDRTIVVCMGEFGRTPAVNPTNGRDHWPNNFSVALAGGRLRGGVVIGETDPNGKDAPKDKVNVGDLHATLLTALGIDPDKVNQTKIGRTVRLADNGKEIQKLLS